MVGVPATGAAGSITAVAGLVAGVEPEVLVPVMTTRRVWPTSAGTRSWVAAVAPGMSVQPEPGASQRRHWRVNTIVGVPVHVPSLEVSVWPSMVVPVIPGAAVAAGVASATAAVGELSASAAPTPLAAWTCRRMVAPTSAGVSR